MPLYEHETKTKLDAARMLNRAASCVEQGWTTGAASRTARTGYPCRATDERAAAWCTVGALVRATADTGIGVSPEMVATDELRIEAGATTLQAWNDREGQTAENVILAMRRAERNLRQAVQAGFDQHPGETIHGQHGRETCVVRRHDSGSSVATVYYAIYGRLDGEPVWYAERLASGMALDVAEAWAWRGEAPADAEDEAVRS
jgi:hypothetical protein